MIERTLPSESEYQYNSPWNIATGFKEIRVGNKTIVEAVVCATINKSR